MNKLLQAPDSPTSMTTLQLMNPADMSQNLDLRVLRSGTGAYSHNSTISVQNDTLSTYSGEFAANSQNIAAKEDTTRFIQG